MDRHSIAVAEGDQESLGTDVCQFVSFFVEGERFATPMAPVQEIIRVPRVARLPMAPPALLGVANLRGQVLPVLSLRRIFGLPEGDAGEAARALVVNLGSPVGFVVDRVASVINTEKKDVEPAEHFQCAVDKELLTGVVKGEHGTLTMVLDFGAIMAREFVESRSAARSELELKTKADAAGEKEEIELEGLVSFTVAGQEYAVPIGVVQEIVQAPPEPVRVPNAAPYVLGLTALRKRVLPLISMHCLLGVDVARVDERQRVVVVGLDVSRTAAIVADTVDEVLRVQRGEVEPMPALLSAGKEAEFVSAILRLEDGKRLVSVLDLAKFFNNAGIQAALQATETSETDMQETESRADRVSDEDEQFVVFQLGAEEYGVPIEAVQEIVRIPDGIARVPKAPEFVEGVMNLRGSVLPVVDQRRRFGMPAASRNERQRILVYTLTVGKVGFIVDSVSEVLKIPKKSIEPAPGVSTGQSKVIRRVANLASNNRLLFLLSPESLLEGAEIQQIRETVEGF
jgi:purine-binding chemotaxis protein CheW